MGAMRILVLVFSFLAAIAAVSGHNITDILSAFPEYSQYNNFLTQTKLNDEINSRRTITVLVLNNGAVSSLAKNPLPVIKNALMVHVLLDYFDNKKLHSISDGSALSATLYQTTGIAEGMTGFVNITDLKGGKVGFASGAPGSKLDSTYTKSVQQIPYNISVLEIDAPIIPPGVLSASADVNITGLLEKAGCKTFARLITDTGVLKMYQAAASKGLTLFAPSDGAFKAAGVPDLNRLTNAEVVSLLQYHAVTRYAPKGSLKTTKSPLTTLATNGAGKFDLIVHTTGDEVTLDTGVDTSRVASTVLDSTPLCIFTVDNVLLPVELFSKSPSAAPGIAPATPPSSSPSPASAASPPPVPASSPPVSAVGPTPYQSPPAPPTFSPAGGPSPDDSPKADSEDTKASHAADGFNSAAYFIALVTVSISVIVTLIMS